jgi:tetratricopeptide (TPR) repeat protein
MKIKSLIFVLSGISLMAFAQKEITQAKSSYERYQSLKSTPGADKLSAGSIKAAKEAIDKGVANPKLQADASLWAYKALIYSDLALLDSVETRITPLLSEATTALAKATELDKDGAQKANIETVKTLLAQNYLNAGVRFYNAKDFPKAFTEMKSGLTYSPKDSVLVLYSALMALYSKDYKSAIAQYNVAVANKQADTAVYNNLVDLYVAEKDTASAIRIAGEGAKLFPKNSSLATKEIEYSLMSGKNKEIIDRITAQAKAEPNNGLLPYYLGIAYSATNDIPKAEEAYKASIAIDPKFAESYINLGSIILNNGIVAYNTANKLPQNQQAQYTAMMTKATTEFERSFPYLKKATELKPTSRLAFMNLRTYYNVKKDTAKSAEVSKILEGLPE